MDQASNNIRRTTITTRHHMLASALVLMPLCDQHGEPFRPIVSL
jgi:hypothetical protein